MIQRLSTKEIRYKMSIVDLHEGKEQFWQNNRTRSTECRQSGARNDEPSGATSPASCESRFGAASASLVFPDKIFKTRL